MYWFIEYACTQLLGLLNSYHTLYHTFVSWFLQLLMYAIIYIFRRFTHHALCY